ncbi:hypothetical protein D6D02_04585 [Aureobasidium pullulans]|nr:hypothetical protein D6D02_04585 [Aureobasidium pullulans]
MERLFSHFEKLKNQYTIVEPIQNYSAVPLLTSQVPASQSTVISQSQSQNIDLNDDLPISRPLRKAVKTARGRRANIASVSSPMLPPITPLPSSIPAPAVPTEQTLEYRMLATGVNLAWKKLNEYYQMTDQSPMVEIKVERATGLARNVREVKTTPLEDDRAPDATAWMDATLTSDEEDTNTSSPKTDEYARWCVEGRVPDVYHPLEFWSKPRIKHSYPRLSRMARDLFTIPAMSDEPERVFSSYGNMVTPQRGKLTGEAIEEAQCIKSWMRHGIITNLGATFESMAWAPEEAPEAQMY